MATYNWKYKSGSFLPKEFTEGVGANVSIAVSADDVKPANTTYVALFGSDTTGNGSRKKPFKTIAKGLSIATQILIIASGTYRESGITVGSSLMILGDGDVTIDGTLLTANFVISGQSFNTYNINFRNFPAVHSGGDYLSCHVNSRFNSASPGDNQGPGAWRNRALRDSVVQYTRLWFTEALRLNDIRGNTFSNMNILFASVSHALFSVNSCIFYRCNIWFSSLPNHIDYSLFFECNFKLTNAAIPQPLVTPNTFYPTVPVGYTNYTTIEDLKVACIIYYGNAPMFEHCLIVDPKFNNPDIGDFSLDFESPAKNLSYLGTYVGAQSIAYPIKAKAVESDGDFDFSTIENLTIEDNSIILTNPELDASVETVVKANLIGRELAEAPIYGSSADRNGQYIDSIADLSNVTIDAGTNLADLTPYIVEAAAIVINGAVIQPGERFTTNGVLSFTSDGGGVCREIIEAPQRHTIMARFGNGGATKTVGDALVAGNWYYPITGTINYNGVNHFAKAFKAIDGHSFTTPDGGTLIEAFTNEEYQHYEPGIKFTSNNVGDVRTGQILRGNGDPGYVRGVGYEFPINARFIQLKYIIRVNNLKP